MKLTDLTLDLEDSQAEILVLKSNLEQQNNETFRSSRLSGVSKELEEKLVAREASIAALQREIDKLHFLVEEKSRLLESTEMKLEKVAKKLKIFEEEQTRWNSEKSILQAEADEKMELLNMYKRKLDEMVSSAPKESKSELIAIQLDEELKIVKEKLSETRFEADQLFAEKNALAVRNQELLEENTRMTVRMRYLSEFKASEMTRSETKKREIPKEDYQNYDAMRASQKQFDDPLPSFKNTEEISSSRRNLDEVRHELRSPEPKMATNSRFLELARSATIGSARKTQTLLFTDDLTPKKQPFTDTISEQKRTKTYEFPSRERVKSKNILSFPSHHKIEENSDQISKLNEELDRLIVERKNVEGALCRYPAIPKKLKEKEKMNELEDQQLEINRQISLIKKNLKELSMH